MYKGLSMSLMSVGPFIAIRMASYDAMMSSSQLQSQGGAKGIAYNMAAGAAAGIIAVSIMYPNDLIKRLLQLNGSKEGAAQQNLVAILNEVYQQEGIKGFYKGYQATVAKNLPMGALMFVTNE